VLVDANGRIAAVGPAGTSPRLDDALVHDLGEAILLPGLVNVHAHPELTIFRGALEDLPFRDWILTLVTTKRARLSDEDHAAAARWAVVESLAAGTTTLAATEASGAAAGALAGAGMRGIVYQEAFGPDPGSASVSRSMRSLEAELERTREMAESAGRNRRVPRGPGAAMPGGSAKRQTGRAEAGARTEAAAISGRVGRSRVTIGVSPHAPYTVSDPLYREVTRLALADRLPMAVHIAESAIERALVVDGAGDFAEGLRARGIPTPPRGRTPIDLLERLGVLEARPLLIHTVDIDEADIAAIAASGSPVAHCPVANAKLGHGIAPVLALREAGVRVGLGTDSVGSNNRLDLLEEARFAALLQRAAERRHDLLSPDDLLRLVTIDGARALGLDDRIGTLEIGKDADLCAVAIRAPHTIPSHDPVATLFHAARGTDVVLTVVEGEVLYEDGVHRTVDVETARAAVRSAGERVKPDG